MDQKKTNKKVFARIMVLKPLTINQDSQVFLFQKGTDFLFCDSKCEGTAFLSHRPRSLSPIPATFYIQSVNSATESQTFPALYSSTPQHFHPKHFKNYNVIYTVHIAYFSSLLFTRKFELPLLRHACQKHTHYTSLT